MRVKFDESATCIPYSRALSRAVFGIEHIHPHDVRIFIVNLRAVCSIELATAECEYARGAAKLIHQTGPRRIVKIRHKGVSHNSDCQLCRFLGATVCAVFHIDQGFHFGIQSPCTKPLIASAHEHSLSFFFHPEAPEVQGTGQFRHFAVRGKSGALVNTFSLVSVSGSWASDGAGSVFPNFTLSFVGLIFLYQDSGTYGVDRN